MLAQQSSQKDSSNTSNESRLDTMSANNLFDLSLEELMGLDVLAETGTFLDVEMKMLPYSVTIIKEKDIENSGARHMSELLEIYVPGFQYMYNKWNGAIWGMRGVAADRNTKFIYLINGHKMNQESRDGATSELTLGLLGDIERIEVIRGPAGVVYGSGAIAGVVNVVTKDFKGEKDYTNTNVSAHTWRMRTGGASAEIMLDRVLNDGAGNINISAGILTSDGTGNEVPRIYGKASWPYPNWRTDIPQDGVPSTGSAWKTDKNMRFGLKLNYGRFTFYSRLTHQEQFASGLFPIDAWPDYPRELDSTASPRMVDGDLQEPDGFYGAIRSYGNNRKIYKTDNLFSQLIYKQPIGGSQLRIELAIDQVANRIVSEDLPQYNQLSATDRGSKVWEEYGENRFTTDVRYILNSLDRFKFSAGYQFKIFDIGNGLAGTNSYEESAIIPVIDNATYFDNAIYAEGRYAILHNLFLHLGARYELHTMTQKYGGVFTPLLAMNYIMAEDHVIKFTYQEAANNGSADNYQYNHNNYNRNGDVISNEYVYEIDDVRPGVSSNIILPVTDDELKSLKPERSQSIELSTVHQFTNRWFGASSFSYNHIENLFVWNQTLFRNLNGGEYNFVNLDFELRYSNDVVNIGLNHTIQKVVNTDLNQALTTEVPVFSGYDSTVTAGGDVYYQPQVVQAADGSDSTRKESLNYIKDGITLDGNNFLNLACNTTKLFMDVNFLKVFTFHTDFRIFWGLKGRSMVYEKEPRFPDLESSDRSIVKWNASVHCQMSNRMKFSFLIYDILGSKFNPRHSLRWQQRATAEQNDLFSMDLRSFAFKFEYTF